MDVVDNLWEAQLVSNLFYFCLCNVEELCQAERLGSYVYAKGGSKLRRVLSGSSGSPRLEALVFSRHEKVHDDVAGLELDGSQVYLVGRMAS